MSGYGGVALAWISGALCIVAGFSLWRRSSLQERWRVDRPPAPQSSSGIWHPAGERTGDYLIWLGVLLFGCGVAGLGALHDRRQQEMLVVTCTLLMAFTFAAIGLAAIARGANHRDS